MENLESGEIRSSGEAQKNIEEYAKRYLNLLKEMAGLNDDIKALKQEYKEEGVPVQIVSTVINRIKREKKKTQSEIFEEETIKDWLLGNTDIDNDIGELAAK